MDTGLGFFDIATFCLVDIPRDRSPMDQVYSCCVLLNTRVTYFTFEGQRPNIQAKRRGRCHDTASAVAEPHNITRGGELQVNRLMYFFDFTFEAK